jgi:hypothetical protein
LVAPTPENLDLYLQWMLKPNHHEVFFGDMVRRYSFLLYCLLVMVVITVIVTVGDGDVIRTFMV